jgi:hypothetical protein
MDWLLIIAVFGVISADAKVERVSEAQCRSILAAKGADDRVTVRCLSPSGEWYGK